MASVLSSTSPPGDGEATSDPATLHKTPEDSSQPPSSAGTTDHPNVSSEDPEPEEPNPFLGYLAPLIPTSISRITPGGREIHLIAIVLSCQGLQFVQSRQKHLRRVRIADASGSIDVTLWGDPAEQVAAADILVFRRAYATLYKGRLTLYTGDRGDVKRVGQFALPFQDRPYLSDPLTYNWSLPELEDRLRARGQLLESAPVVPFSNPASTPQKKARRRRKKRKRSVARNQHQEQQPRPPKQSKMGVEP